MSRTERAILGTRSWMHAHATLRASRDAQHVIVVPLVELLPRRRYAMMRVQTEVLDDAEYAERIHNLGMEQHGKPSPP